MAVEVVEYQAEWPERFARVAETLREAVAGIPGVEIEHVGSTSVPGLAAKPVIDVDVVVDPARVPEAVVALERIGYRHLGDLGLAGREAFRAPDDEPRRNVYVCAAGTLNVRNHLAVRAALRRDQELRDAYAAVKRELAADPGMDIDAYTIGKSEVLQRVLAASDLSEADRLEILRLNSE